MTEKAPVVFRFVVGKGAPVKGKADGTSMSHAINGFVDGLFHGIQSKLGTDKRFEYLSSKRFMTSLEGRLTTLYASGISEALNSWVGAQSGQTANLGLTGFSPFSRDYQSLGVLHNNFKRLPHGYKNSPMAEAMAKARDIHGGVDWDPLTPSTVYAKRKAGHQESASKMFIFTGDLKRELTQANREMVKKTGVVKVTSIDNRDAKGRFAKLDDTRKRVKLGSLRIRLLPNISRSSLPGISSGTWSEDTGTMAFEKKLGLSPETVKKLSGKGSRDDATFEKRPLLQPVFTFYTLFRAPMIISQVMSQTLQQSNIRA